MLHTCKDTFNFVTFATISLLGKRPQTHCGTVAEKQVNADVFHPMCISVSNTAGSNGIRGSRQADRLYVFNSAARLPTPIAVGRKLPEACAESTADMCFAPHAVNHRTDNHSHSHLWKQQI